MGLTKSPNNSGGLWSRHCYVTICSKICSQLLCLLFSFPLPLPFPRSVSPLSCLFFFYSFSHFSFSYPHTSNQLFSFFPSPTLSIFTQLHQLRWRMSATTIMPFEGTTEDEGRDWTGEGACVMGQGPSEKRSRCSWPTGRRIDGQTKRPMESKHETFCIVLHQTTERWDHINSQSVCLLSRCSQLIGPTMN